MLFLRHHGRKMLPREENGTLQEQAVLAVSRSRDSLRTDLEIHHRLIYLVLSLHSDIT